MKTLAIIATTLSLAMASYFVKEQAESSPELTDMSKEMSAYQQEIEAAGSFQDWPPKMTKHLESH